MHDLRRRLIGPNRALLTLLALGIGLSACGAPQGSETASSARQPTQAVRTLVAAIRVEPRFITSKSLIQTGFSLEATTTLFNAGLAQVDDQGNPRPYLAESLPHLNTDDWKFMPDGRMETTYRLRPNLTWHDGTPLTAEDFVLAARVYKSPELGGGSTSPQDRIDEILALDARTVLIRWLSPYPKAGELEATDFPPLPRHVLEPHLGLDADAFTALPFWTTEHVGAGPFRIVRWEPGAFIEAEAFAGHALGRPKIDRLSVPFIVDENAALAGLLSSTVDVTLDEAIRLQQATVVRREWEQNKGGTVLVIPGLWRFTQVQLNPERVNPRSLLDVRVRKALAHGIDKQAVNEGVYDGEAILSDSAIPPNVSYYAAVDRAVVKYPFDPARSEQLMAEAGFVKGPDGFFVGPDGRFVADSWVFQSAQNEAQGTVMASIWRTVGFDIHEVVQPAAMTRDAQARSLFPALSSTGGLLGEEALATMGTRGTPRATNRWFGTNRGSWSNADFDRLADAFQTTLDRNERIQQVVQMVRVFSDELPSIALNFNPQVTAFRSLLTGPKVVAPGVAITWNVHEWEMR